MFLIAGTFLATEALLRRTLQESHGFDSGVDAVSVHVVGGNVEVIGEDREDIVVHSTETRALVGPRGGVRLDDGELRISSACPAHAFGCSSEFEVLVPQGTPVEGTVFFGEADVAGLDSEDSIGVVDHRWTEWFRVLDFLG
ncbi:hypothetical protein BQ8420_26275 [Nocardiopsis sp. JB363]|nr:hypothetical protein BQ8420_26275 [Nocardiopsis sp. JB363]